MNNLRNRIILVTGSSRGIGREISIALAEQGVQVIINGRNKERLELAQNNMRKHGYQSLAIQADISDFHQCEKMIDQIINKYGRLDGLVTNAGLVMEAEFDQADIHALQSIINGHMYGTIFPIKAAMKYIKESEGSILMISSLAGLYGMPRFSAYCTGKMALTAFCQSLQLENRRSNVHIGIMHVAFVQNDEKKFLIDAQGNEIPMLPRPTKLQQSQQRVALSAVKMIKKRRKRKVLSFYGRFYAFIARYSRPLIRFWLNIYFKT